MSTNRRLLLVHAHPDDESIGTGATMAKYVAEGAQVTLVTCTLGDEGEILVPDLAHLAAHDQDKLAGHRLEELAQAMARLGVTDYRILGGIGAYRDSGMIGTEPNQRADCFWQADLLEAAKHLVRIIRETKPQVLVTYDDFGGYGHPDHIQAHRVATYAASLAAVESFAPELGAAWQISKFYWTAFPVSVIRAGIEALRANGEDTGFAAQDPEDIPFACPDEFISTVVDASQYVEQKFAALRAHETQINADSGFFALSNNLGAQVMGFEYFRLAFGDLGTLDSTGNETDLFSGINL
ncbi:MAG: N-acetyl-1-D-myo-inositol-2-amino-2-deoxy-alpha-D-glucopyranoside deacetylase [Actinobacteria bacterium]|nr:N-acetyl-1-D-myo-inositol-2-amino-2-deoxy-alpha-D-glucopyranoside deacetylase [Actinomycetota bacterium]